MQNYAKWKMDTSYLACIPEKKNYGQFPLRYYFLLKYSQPIMNISLLMLWLFYHFCFLHFFCLLGKVIYGSYRKAFRPIIVSGLFVNANQMHQVLAVIEALSKMLMAAFELTFLCVNVSALIDGSECNMMEYLCPLCIVQCPCVVKRRRRRRSW